MRFDSLQPNDSPNVIKINAKKGDKVRLLIQFFTEQIVWLGCSKHEKVKLDSELPSWMLSN